MSFPLRLTLYLLLGGAALLFGRLVFPASGSLLHPEQAAGLLTRARLQFWQEKVQEILVAPDPVKVADPLIAKMSPEDFTSVAEGFKGNDALRSRLAARWAMVDPAGGFKYLANSDLRSPGQQQMASQLVYGWAARDFNSAEAAATRLRVTGIEPDPMKSLAVLILRQDFRKGLAYLEKNTSTLPDGIMIAEMQVTDLKSERWHGATIEQRIEVLQAQPDSVWQETGLEQLYAILLKGNPADLLRAAQNEGRGLKLVAPASENWLKQDQDSAAVFFQNEAKDQVRATLGLAMARAFAQKDPSAAWEFAQTNLSGHPRASAKLAILAAQTTRDPVVASRWLKDIPDAPWRNQALVFLNKSWTALDPAAAKQWRETELTPQDQHALEQKP